MLNVFDTKLVLVLSRPGDPSPAPAVNILRSALTGFVATRTLTFRVVQLIGSALLPLVPARFLCCKLQLFAVSATFCPLPKLQFCSPLTLRAIENKSGTMEEDKLEAFKQVIRRRIDMRRMVAVCAGDEEQARSLVVKGLRDIAGEIERDGFNPRVRWDTKRNISIMNTD